MKNTIGRLLFWLNYILVILYMAHQVSRGQTIIESSVAILISSLMLIDSTYISACNIRDNKVITLFCGLLALDSWYILLSFSESAAEGFIFIALSPLIWYVSIRFVLMFLFQGSGYKFQKAVHVVLLAACTGSLAGICISDRVYACFYGIQFLLSCLCFLFIVIYHWKRAAFVLKNEWKSLSFSAAVIMFLFLLYYFATLDVHGHISNFGIYLPGLLFLMSIHGIVLKENSGSPLSTIFSKKQLTLMIILFLLIPGLAVMLTGGSYGEWCIAVNILFSFTYICNIVLGYNLRKGESRLIKESQYGEALRQLKQEELLKAEFANFLHDDVLQDLLSVKNMMTKVHRPDVQDMIIETLDGLNNHIRSQMQDYHPVILKNLTAKENYQNLIEAVSQSFPGRNMQISFDCPENLFLVEPYNVFIYRMLKELLTNAFRHSDGSQVWVMLTLENGTIELSVSDDGNAGANALITADKAKHKGIASVKEQVNNMDGLMTISDNTPHGIRVHISIPMKGDVSYQYFIS